AAASRGAPRAAITTGPPPRGGAAPDDLDGTSSATSPDPAHTHPDRERDARRVTGRDGQGAAVEDDSVSLQVVNRAALDAGQIVPTRAFPTTGRVWTYLDADVAHELSVVHQRAPDRELCDGPCCENHTCRCRPDFSLVFQRSGGAVIDVGGAQYRLSRRTGVFTYEPWAIS
ncbi:MAG: hypothetical protein ACT4OX_14735, partial [Actinomycetota bacterium]